MVIGGALFVMAMTCILTLMVQLGSYYGVSVESTYNINQYTTGYQTIAQQQTQVLFNGTQSSSINQNVANTAQGQGAISAESSKVGYTTIVITAMSDFFTLYPVNSVIGAMIAVILLAIFSAALFYTLFKTVP